MSEPFEAIGFPPTTRNRSVRSMSGTGMSSWWPNICQARSWWGHWSTEEALNRLRVRRLRTSAVPCVAEPREWALGLPR
jgi:hypothetical protein